MDVQESGLQDRDSAGARRLRAVGESRLGVIRPTCRRSPNSLLDSPTYEGFPIRALYTSLDALPEQPLPGDWPFVRGGDALRDVKTGWKVAEAFPVAGQKAVTDGNGAVLVALTEGVKQYDESKPCHPARATAPSPILLHTLGQGNQDTVPLPSPRPGGGNGKSFGGPSNWTPRRQRVAAATLVAGEVAGYPRLGATRPGWCTTHGSGILHRWANPADVPGFRRQGRPDHAESIWPTRPRRPSASAPWIPVDLRSVRL